jgi:hypothetical protein
MRRRKKPELIYRDFLMLSLLLNHLELKSNYEIVHLIKLLDIIELLIYIFLLVNKLMRDYFLFLQHLDHLDRNVLYRYQ